MNKTDFQKYFDEPITNCESVSNVGNNRLYKISSRSKRHMVKVYSQIHANNWNRGEREFLALNYLWKNGFREIPEPLKFFPEDDCGIYSFEEGKVLSPKNVGKKDIVAMVNFISRIHSLPCDDFPPASTPALCLDEYVIDIETRISILEKSWVDLKGRELLYAEVIPMAKRVVQEFLEGSQENLHRPLPLEEQRLCFGDFGVHNVLFSPPGSYTFLDFEYFGRDDPAREILGFVHHDKHSKINKNLLELFAEKYLSGCKDKESVSERILMADPLVGMRWVLTYLNVLRGDYLQQLELQGVRNIDKIVQQRKNKARKKLENLNFFN